MGAPPVAAFRAVLAHIRKAGKVRSALPDVGGVAKMRSITTSLGEAALRVDQRFIMDKAAPLKSLTLIRDGRAGKMLFRFVAVNSKLRTRRGVFAFASKAASGAAGIVKTASEAIKTFSTVHRGCPRLRRMVGPMRRKLRRRWRVACTDGAAEEITASELLRSAFKTAPNLGLVSRDKGQDSGKVCSRPWGADGMSA